MFDSHCHLHDPRVLDAAAAIERARAAGVRGFLLAGVDPEGWRDQDRLRSGNADVYSAVGVHPQRVRDLDEPGAAAMLEALGARLHQPGGPRAEAVGEIGLDGLPEHRGALPLQERVFRAQLALARAADLPVVLHVLRAHGHALAILRADGLPRRGGVVHSYSGPPDLVPAYLALGLSLSFAGSVTRAASRRARESVPLVPRDRLLVETDAPDQTPAPRQGQQNEPALLPLVVAAVAALRGERAEEVAAFTEANARRLLGLPAAPLAVPPAASPATSPATSPG